MAIHSESEWLKKWECFEFIQEQFHKYAREHGGRKAFIEYSIKCMVVYDLECGSYICVSRDTLDEMKEDGWEEPRGTRIYEINFDKGYLVLDFTD